MKPLNLDWEDVVNKDGTYLLRHSIEHPESPKLVARIYRMARKGLVPVMMYELPATTYELQVEGRFRGNFLFMSAKQVSAMLEFSKKNQPWGPEEDW